jgi:hypothetical protein
MVDTDALMLLHAVGRPDSPPSRSVTETAPVEAG